MYCDRMIDKIILGQSGTSGEEGAAVGSFARNKVLENVRQDIVEAVALWVGGIMAALADDIVAENAGLLGVGLDQDGRAVGLDPIVIDWDFPDEEEDAAWERRRIAINETYERGLPVSRAEYYMLNRITDPDPGAGNILVKPEEEPGIPGLPFSARHGTIHSFQAVGVVEEPKIVADFVPHAAAAHAEANSTAYDPIEDRLRAGLAKITRRDWDKGFEAVAAKFQEGLTDEIEAIEQLARGLSNGIVHMDMIGRHAVDYSRIVSVEENDNAPIPDRTQEAALAARVNLQSDDEARAEFLRQIGIYSRMEDDNLIGADTFFLAPDEVAQIFDNAQIVNPIAFAETLERSDRWAFHVAGLESEAQTARMLQSLKIAQESGQSFRNFMAGVDESLKRSLSPSRLETIYRTNMQQGTAVGEWARMNDPTVKQATKYWRYFNPDDSRSRPAHAALNGFMAPPDDPAWDTINPPNGFNCRCGKRVIWNDEPLARRQPSAFPTLPDGTLAEPDPGFQQNTARLHLEGNPEAATQ
jgi:SPP1 gp7 family putative phage head morphogenesis protein